MRPNVLLSPYNNFLHKKINVLNKVRQNCVKMVIFGIMSEYWSFQHLVKLQIGFTTYWFKS